LSVSVVRMTTPIRATTPRTRATAYTLIITRRVKARRDVRCLPPTPASARSGCGTFRRSARGFHTGLALPPTRRLRRRVPSPFADAQGDKGGLNRRVPPGPDGDAGRGLRRRGCPLPR